MKKAIVKIIPVLIISTLLFSGCGRSDELSDFREKIDSFCDKIVMIDSNMNSINPESEGAVRTLLANLDELDIIFAELAEYPVPDNFSYIETLADEASENMTQAVALYHDAYSNGSYNEYTAGYAAEYYARAYKRVKYIIVMLHGEMPEGDDVTIIHGDEDTLDELQKE